MATQTSVLERTGTKIEEPKKYNVVMHNDDFTTMDFVVSVLKEIFHKSDAEAEALMLKVHNIGSAVVGCYPYDIAVSKTTAALKRAKIEGFPFKMTVEEG